MAKTLIQLKNGLRVKYLVKPKKHYLFIGSRQIRINSEWQRGFKTQEEAELIGNKLTNTCQFIDLWSS